ncbi:hypothetical protein Tco_0256977 [Tanacetum coccineum]
MLLTTVPVVPKHVQSISPLVNPVRRCGNPASGYESYMLAAHSELPYSTRWNVPKPLGKLGPPGPTVVQSHSETIYPRTICQLFDISESACPECPQSQHKYPECPAPAPQRARAVASVRRHLQLADSDGISSLPTTKIFEQLSLMGNMKRAFKGYTGENIPLFLAMIVQGIVVQGEGSTHLVESHHTPTSTPSTSQPPVSPTFKRTTRQESVVPQPRSPTQTLVADEAASTVESSETDLKQTKKIYGAAYTRLIKKMKKLEKTAKSSQARRRERIVVSNDEVDLEDPSKQGRKIAVIDQDLGISLVQHDAEIQGRHGHDMEFDFNFDAAKEVSTAEKDVSTTEPVSTVGAAVTTASVAVSTVCNTPK